MTEEITTPETTDNSNGQGMTLVFKTHFKQRGRGKELCEGEKPPTPPPPPVFRTPRITKYMALAIHLQGLIDDNKVLDYSHIASLAGLTRARITQIMNLNLLAPRIHEDIIFLPKIRQGSDPISERAIRSIALEPRWDKQITAWKEISEKCTP
jgi:hypothetical protein